MRVVEILEGTARKFPTKPAIIFQDQPVSFPKCKQTVFKLSQGLIGLGIRKQDKIAVYLPNCPEYIYSYLALWCIGATVVPLDYMLTEDELVSCITHSEARCLIARTKENINFGGLKSKIPSLENIIFINEKTEGFWSFDEVVDKGRPIKPDIDIKDSDYSIIFYTSGTTGKPKGVLVSYKQLEAPARHMCYFINEFQEDEIEVAAVPFSHLGGLVYILISLFWGVSLIVMERFSPLDFLKNVERYKVTSFFIVPSMYYAFLRLKEFMNIDLSSLRWIVSFGASGSLEAINRFRQVCPRAVFYHGWGMTETNAPTTASSQEPESVGKPAPGFELKIFSDNDKELSTGEIGEVVVRGWIVTDGYYKDPELTKTVMRNGWFHTGDLGRFNQEGFLYIMGRKKEMIKVGGQIVFEPEVESTLHKDPDIAEVAVIGVPDKLRGEVPCAFVVFKQGIDKSADDVRFFARQHLAHFKVPHYIEIVKDIPKTRSGKIDKAILRAKVNAQSLL